MPPEREPVKNSRKSCSPGGWDAPGEKHLVEAVAPVPQSLRSEAKVALPDALEIFLGQKRTGPTGNGRQEKTRKWAEPTRNTAGLPIASLWQA